MILSLSLQVRRVRNFRAVKPAKSNRLVVDFDFGRPFTVGFANTWEPAGVRFSRAILRVFRVGGWPQIANTVVLPIAINMVQLMRWPLSVRVQPRQSVRGVQSVVKANNPVAVLHLASRNIADTASSALQRPPKCSGARIVMNQFFQTFLRYGAHANNNIMLGARCQA